MPEDTDPTTPPVDDPEEKDPAWYRDQMSAKDVEIKELTKTTNRQRVKLMEETFSKVGLDPAVGLGKAIAEKYQGEPTVDDLRTFAIEEYSWEPPEELEENPLAKPIVDAQGRVDKAVKAADSTQQSAVDLQIAEAEEKGDFATSIMLKVAKYRTAKGI